MRFETTFLLEPSLCTVQLFGFGVLLYCRDAFVPSMVERMEKDIWPIPIYPGWRFAVVTPWH